MDRVISAYADWVGKRRFWLVGASIVLVAVLGWGLSGLSFTSDYRIYFGESNPEREAYEQFENTYVQTDNILLVVKPKEGDIFTARVLGAVRDLTEESWQVPHAIRVDSITNYQHIAAQGDDLTVEDLVSEGRTLDSAEIDRIRRAAFNSDDLVGRLLATDGEATGINITLQFPGEEHHAHLKDAIETARELVDSYKARYPGLDVVMTGIAPLGYAEYSVSERETRTLFPWVLVVLLGIAWFLFRSITGVLMVGSVIALSGVATLGFFGWLGYAINTSSAAAPVVVMTLAVADTTHILLTAIQAIGEGKPKSVAIREALVLNWEPVFLTSLTTAVGFLSLNFSDVPPFHDVGNIAAFGSGAAWLFSVTFVPALLYMLPLKKSGSAEVQIAVMKRLAEFVIRFRKPLVGILLMVPLVSVVMISTITLDDRFVKWFDKSETVRRDTDFASRHLVGPYQLELSLPAGEAEGIYEPSYLEKLSEFQAWLSRQEEVSHVSSIVPLLKRINRAMHGGDEDYYRLPPSRSHTAQYILLYELSLPYGLDLTTKIALDKSASRVTVMLKDVTSAEIRGLSDRITTWLSANTPPEMHTSPTGTALIFATLAERNIIAMLWGTAVAFLVIALVLVVALRSIGLGLLSLIPNGLPVLITFGLWAIFVGEIGIIASVIAATSMGLIVDDTVHILSKYRRARMVEDLTPPDAVRYVFAHVGTALWATSLILICGLLVLTLSVFKLNQQLGILTAITIGNALLMDLLLLPGLLILLAEASQRFLQRS